MKFLEEAESPLLTMNRERFFYSLPLMSLGDREEVQLAYHIAKDAHRKQLRDGGERYFEHARGVALILIERGVRPATAFIKALLHDALEDSFVPIAMYIQCFGIELYRSLDTLSKLIPVFDPITGKLRGRLKKPIAEYFAALAIASVEDRLVKLADRLHNLRSMGSWPIERQRKYVRETVEWLLPIADATDPWFAQQLRTEIAKVPMD